MKHWFDWKLFFKEINEKKYIYISKENKRRIEQKKKKNIFNNINEYRKQHINVNYKFNVLVLCIINLILKVSSFSIRRNY